MASFKFLWLVLVFLRITGLVCTSTEANCLWNTAHQPYTGTVGVTNHGYTCQAWASQSPHRHLTSKDVLFPDDGGVTEASNFCRNFGGSGRPWCYTVNPYITYEFCDHQICGETGNARSITLTNSSGLINAPDATGRGLYDENVDILWIIEALDGQIIRFHILFAQIRYSDNCYKDGLRIYEASLLADQVMVCNFFIGPSDLSMQGETMTSTLFVQFYSDFTLSGVGFELSYEQIGALNKSCNSSITEPSGMIASPDLDQDGYYDMNVDCLWTVTVDINLLIRYDDKNVPCLHQDWESNGASYKCYNDGTIVFHNPRSELYKYSWAVQNGRQCTTLYVESVHQVFVTNFDYTKPIILVVSKSPVTAAQILNNADIFLLECRV